MPKFTELQDLAITIVIHACIGVLDQAARPGRPPVHLSSLPAAI
jgi:hypothetical protein